MASSQRAGAFQEGRSSKRRCLGGRWVKQITGFKEETPDQVRENLEIKGSTMTSRVNGRVMTFGALETPSLGELRDLMLKAPSTTCGKSTLREVVADAQKLHADPSNAGATFQVASQFNLLEMVGPSVTPEEGIACYEGDRTQGPACAIACGAGTMYRNYFADVGGGVVGQTEGRQIDCLEDLGNALGNEDGHLWTMRNGYALANEAGLDEISAKLKTATEEERDQLRQHLRVGVQLDTEVTLPGAGHTVTQVYGSALPVSYSDVSSRKWANFATLVLEASYEATFAAALLKAADSGNNTLYLTLLGGGAFGNEEEWIFDAIRRAMKLYADSGLDVAIVSYGCSNREVREFIGETI